LIQFNAGVVIHLAAPFLFPAIQTRKEVINLPEKYPGPSQQALFNPSASNRHHSKFIAAYRVMLVRDQHLPFEHDKLSNSREAHAITRKLIKTYGQSDREQFCVVLLNTKNEVIGLNIVSTGAVSYAHVHPREVLKPAILANAAAMILCHNHPSGDVSPSQEDEVITARIIQACHIVGIQVHEHLIISICDDRYYSFADNGIIKRIYDSIG
jgi:DNA repair protein RadC